MGKGRILLAGTQFSGEPKRKPYNIETATRLIRLAAERGAQIIMTPEAAINGYGGNAHDAAAEPIPGPATDAFCDLARSLGVYLLIGLYEEIEGQFCNAMTVIDPEGELMGVMRKVHLNRYETPGGWRNGSDFPVWQFDTATGNMTAGIMICYDRELPESARVLMLKGADVIFNPLACRCPKDEIHRCLLRTRAFENELYVFMVNHCEPRQNGHSFAVDYDGYIRAELDDQEGLLIYEVDLDALEKRRKDGIYGKHHRRPELYESLTDPAGQIHPENANLPRRARTRMG
ncbi:MAG: carbon-nitrogen hydrolase family protein [Candidatus Hydrogenedentes bacterium]|nr:carbon-nitrogen hydrolase family protein [Candidatus Hydrogenedentota bacterium]